MSKDNKRSPGGIILPPNAELVAIQPEAFFIGGTAIESPPDPRLVIQVKPDVLRNPDQLLGLIAAILNTNNALVREVNRHRAHLGLPEWTPDLGMDPDGTAETEPDGTEEIEPDHASAEASQKEA